MARRGLQVDVACCWVGDVAGEDVDLRIVGIVVVVENVALGPQVDGLSGRDAAEIEIAFHHFDSGDAAGIQAEGDQVVDSQRADASDARVKIGCREVGRHLLQA